ncbi:hypothetical protein VTN00DRAFT_1 [Thermoascus crustaceus]|uniref:uncharacterized protein n=1 Tax=Thermoascus crustaceus TaxID=5088 RepID=UPI003744469D
MSEEVGKYSRGSLSSTTLQDLMMFRCMSKFDIEEEDNIEEYDLTPDEKQLRDEIQEAQLKEYSPDPISDHEESDREEEDDQAEERPRDNDNRDSVQVQLTMPSQRALGKRRRIEVDEATVSADDEALPETQQRVSRRMRVRPERKDDGFDHY